MKDYALEQEQIRNESLDETYQYNEFLRAGRKVCKKCGVEKWMRSRRDTCFSCQKQPTVLGIVVHYPDFESYGEINSYLGM